MHELGWARPMPHLMQLHASEWQMLHAGPHPSLLLDSTVAVKGAQAEAFDVASKALAGPLLPSQQLLMLALMDTDPHLVQTMQVQPQQLAALVEHNPMLAFQVLMRIRGSRRVERFHQVLGQMPLSLHSMEVINKLTASGCLPPDVLQMYISNCINSCDDIPDKFMQSRLVRLVCVFLQSLLRHRLINLAGLLLEVQAFCVRFSRIREAATLFRALKQLEQGGSSPVAAATAAGHSSRTAVLQED